MKFIVSALAGLVSLASGHKMHYDASLERRQRADKFYESLVLTQIDQFNPEEQTQFVLSEVGTVCQAYQDYALFDFNKLKSLNTGIKDKPQIVHKVSNKVSDKVYLVYQICGGTFTPDQSRMNTAGIITDTASCTEMAKDETKGNMYIVDNGKCVQSFWQGSFSSTVEKDPDATDKDDDKTKGFKQEWYLNYTSLQKCYEGTDDAKNEVKIQGVCSNDETTFETAEVGTCSITLNYKSEGACFISYIPIQKYLGMVAPFTGIILIVVGLVMCFYGSRFLPFMIAFLVALGVTGVIGLIGYNFLNPMKSTMMHIVILLIVALIFGIIAGILAWKLARNWGTKILAFWCGILLAIMILKMAQVQNQNITLVAAAAGGVIGLIIGHYFKQGIEKFGTAFVGSFMIIRGLACYIGHFPSEFNTGAAQKLVDGKSNSDLFYVIGYVIAFIVIAIGGAVFQYKKLPEYASEADKNVMDDEDEAKCCGVF